MNKEIALKSLREKFSEVSNEMIYNREKTRQITIPQRNQRKMSDLTIKDYNKMIHFSLVEVVLAEEALEAAKYKRGFLGTTDHMFIARKLLLARLRVEALRLARARSEFRQPKDTVSTSNVNGRITAHDIKIDTAPLNNVVAAPHFCYVMVVENDVKIVASRPIKPDRQGIVTFPGCMVFDQQTCDFQLKMSLYKLSLVKPPVQSWTKKIKKLWQGVEIPQFELMGYRTINMTNIDQKVFRFSDATLYMQLRVTVGTGVGPMRTPLAVGSLIQNTFFYGGRLAVLENTDLKLYKTAADLQDGKIDLVFPLFDCHTCDVYENSSEILKLTTWNNSVELFIYFPDKMAQILWQNAFNFAISCGNRWKKAL